MENLFNSKTCFLCKVKMYCCTKFATIICVYISPLSILIVYNHILTFVYSITFIYIKIWRYAIINIFRTSNDTTYTFSYPYSSYPIITSENFLIELEHNICAEYSHPVKPTNIHKTSLNPNIGYDFLSPFTLRWYQRCVFPQLFFTLPYTIFY